MGDQPDTMINGITYQIIDRIVEAGSTSQPWLPRYYVRSDAEGNGFVYLPELEAEYLTGSLNFSVGDTVHDVLMIQEGGCDEVFYFNSIEYVLAALKIVSIDTITNSGVSVVRYYIQSTCGPDLPLYFWQQGMGTEFGPVLVISDGLAEVVLWHASVDDTCRYNRFTTPQGLPGGPSCCVYIESSIQANSLPASSPLSVMYRPDLLEGGIMIDVPGVVGFVDLKIFDPIGKLAYSNARTTGITLIDLQGRRGLFTVVAGNASWRGVGRVLVE